MSTHNLIIQSEDIETGDLKTLHALARASGIEQISGSFSHQAFRLLDADISRKAQIEMHCQHTGLDFAFVQADATLADFGLIAMDMDSTLITIECIDEIADYAGKKSEVAAVTAAAMRGEIDWPASLRQRVATLAGLPENTLQHVYAERLQLSPGAEQLAATARRANIRLLLVSGGFTFFTEKLKARLGIDYAFSNILEIADGALTGRVVGPLCDAGAKARHLRNTASLLALPADRVLAIGDGANDLAMMAAAGTSIAYHAKPMVRAQASHALSHVGLDGIFALFPATSAR
ncbi:MAG TPA: phosphoserine phosphatase SerB [Usitatibacteraceae bacterium]